MNPAELAEKLDEYESEIREIDAQISSLRARRKEVDLLRQKVLQLISREQDVPRQALQDKWDNDGFEWSKRAQTVLRESFKLDSFRPLQRAVINCLMSGNDTIAIMSTGAGKSLCYQLPAVLSDGLTVVVSPLIALIEDQLNQLNRLGIEAATLNQSTSKEEVKRIEAAITNRSSDFRILYVTPEKLAKSKRIMNKLEKSSEIKFLKFIAIDETHCCSTWGNDFRPDYKFLNVLKRQFKVPILGLTATATTNVIEDVKEMLGIPAAVVIRAELNRKNLFFEVCEKPDSIADLAKLIRTRFGNSTGIIYCLSRKDCEEVAKKLREERIRASFYHAYLEGENRTRVHQSWIEGKTQVIVATVAFGMGIDKPDVRFVIHYSIPKSLENYYQEAGRAGRDGNPASCILFFRLTDVFRQSQMVCTEKTGMANLYSLVRYANDKWNCRRRILSQHFEDEEWQCVNGCDTCSNSPSKTKREVIEVAKCAISIIRENLTSGKEGSGRITGLKLVDLLSKKKSIGKTYAEEVVTFMLLESYLKEDFHFTPYSIISYVVEGAKWRDGLSSLEMTSRGKADEAKSRKRRADDVITVD